MSVSYGPNHTHGEGCQLARIYFINTTAQTRLQGTTMDSRIQGESSAVMKTDCEVLAELDLGPPPQELLDWAKKNINEDPDTRCKMLEEFRSMVYSRGECTPHRTDDPFLLRFLRARNFNIPRAHRLLVNYYDFKENNPQFYDNVHLKQLQMLGDDDIITVPPYKTQDGRRILLYRWGNWDPKKYSTDEIFQATMVILEIAILEERAQILGGICIFDLGGLSMQQAWHMTPSVARNIVAIMTSSFPMKIQAIHIVNQSWLFDMVFNFFKPMLDERMKERIFFHGSDFDALHEHIDPKHLPEKYGGVHPDYNYNEWMNYFYRTDKIITELMSLGYHDEEIEGIIQKLRLEEETNKSS